MDSDVASQAQSLIADVICDTGNIQGAIQHFKRLFEGGRDQWGILGRMMPLLHRNRQLDLAQQYIKQINDKSSAAARAYCLGMLDAYQLRTESAMIHLLQAKRSPRWRTQAIHAIIDIALGLESEELNMDEDAVNLCKQLLYELPQNDVETKIYQNWVLLANNDLVDGINGFQALDRKCHVAALTGSCAGLIMQGNGKVAKNQLVSVVSTPWNMKVAKHLEKARLLLGQELINAGKPGKAREELEKILEKNRGCWRAMELRGITFEMEKNDEEATKSFEYAWKMCSQNNPAIGFRLAQSYVKVDKAIRSISICHHVLKNFPDYPQIGEEIMEPALYQVRV